MTLKDPMTIYNSHPLISPTNIAVHGMTQFIESPSIISWMKTGWTRYDHNGQNIFGISVEKTIRGICSQYVVTQKAIQGSMTCNWYSNCVSG